MELTGKVRDKATMVAGCKRVQPLFRGSLVPLPADEACMKSQFAIRKSHPYTT